MYKKLFIILALPFLISACAKKADPYKCTFTAPTTVASSAEVTALENYINSKGLAGSVTRHPNGFFYKIDDAGTGVAPTVCSNIVVTYQGKLTNDTQFDQNTTGASFVLGQLIAGWQLGLPLIKKGGSIKLYLPPSLGYGDVASPKIPANSILIFELTLIDVAN